MKLLFGRLTPEQDRDGFSCGVAALDTYLRRQAGQDMRRGFATVITAREAGAPEKVVGYYTLSAAPVLLSDLPEDMGRRLPRYPAVPAIRLGRLAVDAAAQGRHVGSLLVLDALARACANELAWALFLVDAKEERAARFYKRFLFRRFEESGLALWMTRRQAERLAGRTATP